MSTFSDYIPAEHWAPFKESVRMGFAICGRKTGEVGLRYEGPELNAIFPRQRFNLPNKCLYSTESHRKSFSWSCHSLSVTLAKAFNLFDLQVPHW